MRQIYVLWFSKDVSARSDVDGGGPLAPAKGEYSYDTLSSPELNNCALQPPIDTKDDDSILVYYQNVRGLRTKVDDTFLATRDCNYDVIILTETGLDECIHSQQLFGSCFNVFRCDRSPLNSNRRRFGGVLIAVARQHNSRPLDSMNGSQLEQKCVAARIRGRNVVLCAIYIPPDKSNDVRIIDAHVATVSEISDAPDGTVLICGDYNQPRITWIDGTCSTTSLPPAACSLIDGMNFANLCQINDITNHLGRTLDLAFCNVNSMFTVEESAVPLLPIDLHHPPLVLSLPARTVDHVAVPDRSRRPLNFRKLNFTALSNYLLELDWTNILDGMDVDDMVQTFCTILTDWLNEHVPLCNKPVSPAWSTKRLKDLRRDKNAARRFHRRVKTAASKGDFRKASDVYRRLNASLYKSYVLRVQVNLKQNPRSFWSFVNSKRKSTDIPNDVFLDDSVAHKSSDAAELFARHFASVFATSTASFAEAQLAAADVPADLIDLDTFHVTADMVTAAARKLKNSFAAGPDGVPAVVYRRCIDVLVEPLCIIFNRSLQQHFPNAWKTSIMTPVFKNGDKHNVRNYRGITNLSAGSKLLEIVVAKVLLSQTKNYIDIDQHGFMPGRSVTTNLLEFASTCINNLERKIQVDTVYTDLKAAFDRIDHEILLCKLARLGVSRNMIRWLRSYLVGRTLRVRIDSSTSGSFVNISGVPQGSNLGPLLFILFLNDFIQSLEPGCKLVYADDIKLFLAIHSAVDCQRLQGLLDRFVSWCERNRLIISIPKCAIMTFHRTHRPIMFNYEINGVVLRRVEKMCDLGVTMDPQLSFDLHRSAIIAKANRQLGFIAKISKDFTDPYCLKSLYCALVRPILENAVLVWSPPQLTWILRIERVQRRFIRLALRCLPWRDPVNLPPYVERCRLLDLDTLERRRKIQQATFVAKLLNGELDAAWLLSSLNFRVLPRVVRSSSLLQPNFHRTSYGYNEPIASMTRMFLLAEELFEFGEPTICFTRKLNRSPLL